MTLELIHGYSRELGSGVMLSLILMNLVNRDGGVNNRWLNSLFLDNRLDVLVDVVVDVFTCDSSTC